MTCRRTSAIWPNILLIAISVGLSLAILEGGLRYFRPHALTAKLLLPPDLNRVFETDEFSSQVRTNSLGFRSKPIKPSDPDNMWRIAVIGDSYTFGWGVENSETYPAQMEAILSRSASRAVEVINAGRPGDGLAEYLATLHQHVLRLQPKDIVVGFLPGNDCPVGSPKNLLSDAQVADRIANLARQARSPRKKVRSYLGRLFTARFADPVRRWLRPRLELGEAGQGIVSDPLTGAGNPLNPRRISARLDGKQVFRTRYDALSKAGWIRRGELWQVSPWMLAGAIFDPEFHARALFLDPASRVAMESQWQVCEGLLREMDVVATAAGVRFHILVLASSYQVDPSVIETRRRIGIRIPKSALTDRTTDLKIREFCQRSRISCIHTLSQIRNTTVVGKQLYYPVDGHPTAETLRMFAAAAASALVPGSDR